MPEDLAHTAVPGIKIERGTRRSFGRRVAEALRALVAGMAASKDYRHLNAMTDGQLKQLGLTRKDIPRELHRRHFARLGGRSCGHE